MSFKPALFVAAAPLVFATVIFPPIGIVAGLAAGVALLVKWLLASQQRAARTAHRRRMDAYYAEMDRRAVEAQRAAILAEARNAPTMNPGWRL